MIISNIYLVMNPQKSVPALFILLAIFPSLWFILFYPVTVLSQESAATEFSSVEERRIYDLMQQERANLQKDKKDLDIREMELKTLEGSVDKKIAEIDSKLDELKKLQKKIESLLAEKTAAEKKRTLELSKIYEKMAPEKAALAISGMEPKLATELLANMKPKAAAKILDMLDKNRASQLSTTFTTIQIE